MLPLIEVLLLTLGLILSAIFGGETSTSLSFAPAGNYYGHDSVGNTISGVEGGIVAQKSWGTGPTKLITGTKIGLLGPWFKMVASVGIAGTLVDARPFSLEYYVLPNVGAIAGYWVGYPSLGMEGYLEASVEVLPRFSLYADAGVGGWLVPEITHYGYYFPLGLGMKLGLDAYKRK